MPFCYFCLLTSHSLQIHPYNRHDLNICDGKREGPGGNMTSHSLQIHPYNRHDLNICDGKREGPGGNMAALTDFRVWLSCLLVIHEVCGMHPPISIRFT